MFRPVWKWQVLFVHDTPRLVGDNFIGLREERTKIRRFWFHGCRLSFWSTSCCKTVRQNQCSSTPNLCPHVFPTLRYWWYIYIYTIYMCVCAWGVLIRIQFQKLGAWGTDFLLAKVVQMSMIGRNNGGIQWCRDSWACSSAFDSVHEFFGTWQSLTLASPFGPPGHYYEDNKAKAVVVVTHGLAMRLILMQLFHWSPNTFHTVWSLCLV